MKKLLIGAVLCLSVQQSGAYHQGQQSGPPSPAALKKYYFYNETNRPLLIQRREFGSESYLSSNTVGLRSRVHQGMWPNALFVDISRLSDPGHSHCKNSPTSPGCTGYIGTVFMPPSDTYEKGKNCFIRMKADDTQASSVDAFTPEGSAYYIECVQR